MKKRKSAVERLAEDIEGSARALAWFYLAQIAVGLIIAAAVAGYVLGLD